ncbi:hypothetical protein WSM22_37800 [Cytophagales bacterium WSM2-2]|nr:hypothetical protein WSM22_37800 [Cytophagales bacterium WSM2-2]
MLRIPLLLFFTLTAILSHAQTESQKKYIPDDLDVTIENLPATDTNPNRYTIDNKVYRIGRKLIYNYYIVKAGDTLKFTVPKFSAPGGDFLREEWQFISKSRAHEDKVETISIEVQPGISNKNQTPLQYGYQYANDKEAGFSSTSGVIENEMNTWMHPWRDRYFMILELNPFPYIRAPFTVGNEWTWSLRVGDHWQDPRWKTWHGSIKIDYKYKIVRREEVKMTVGPSTKVPQLFNCWVIEGTATSPLGITRLTAYYHAGAGFLKLDYTNIDGSKLMVELVAIK